MRALWLILVLFTFPLVSKTDAQQTPPLAWQVFVSRNVDALGQDNLRFLNIVTGEEVSTLVNGERFSIAGDAVMFYDVTLSRVRLAGPEGGVIDHPFIQPQANTRRIDWLLSPNADHIIWTLTTGNPNALSTVTMFADVDGSDTRQLLVDGPRDGIRAMPVAFSPDGATLYMDYQPDSIGELTPFRQYAGLFAVDIASGNSIMLPDEPGCFCGAGLGGGKFLRMTLTSDLRGFDARLYDLPDGPGSLIPALNLVGFTQSGDVLMAADGSRAVYALAQITNFGTAAMSTRTVFVLVDLENRTQTALTQPLDTFVRPLAWTDENSAILLTSPTLEGTWKINLSDGNLVRIAGATYIGLID
jgi:hypothetical protein